MKQTELRLTPEEVQSGYNRQQSAEGLILQLPDSHNSRNSWLLNFGKKVKARELRAIHHLRFNPVYDAICDEPPKERSMKKVKNMYKIHGLTTANGEHKGHNTNKFYETYEDALVMAKKCVKQRGNSVVIYKAINIVELRDQPIMVTPVVEDDLT